MSKYLFLISHPAHFHMFKYTMQILKNNDHDIVAVIRPKDVLEELCKESGLNYFKVNERRETKCIFSLGISLLSRVVDVWKIVKKEKPDLLIGSDGVLSYVGFLKRIPSFEFFEDDVAVIKLYASLFFPFYSKIVSPIVTDAGRWKSKQIRYAGYQKLAYLHPNYFVADEEILSKYDLKANTYFILRFSNLCAHHDVGIGGFTMDDILKVIEILKPHGKIYITSEKKLDERLEPYRLKISPSDLHQVLAFSIMLIGDSQSMSVESAMLGRPSVRFSDFAGKISVLEELEHKYGLTYGIKTKNPELLFNKIEELLVMPDLREEFQRRRQTMLADKIDVTAFFVWFIENYPESALIMKENPDYQYRFK